MTRKPPLTDDEKQAWRDLLEGVLDGGTEIPQHLTVDRAWGGQRYMLAPMHPEDDES